MSGGSRLPLEGILGVVRGTADEVENDLRRIVRVVERAPEGTVGVEVRADLLDSPGFALEVLERLSPSVKALFTLRLERQGGRYQGGDAERLPLLRTALERGAALVDVEWESEASRALLAEGAPVVLSHHCFEGMFAAPELDSLTANMEATGALAIKVVPTASEPRDGLRMLEWVAAARAGGPSRIGFAMGEEAFFSRVLCLAWGSPLTYAALGAANAPGQGTLEDFVDLYRATSIRRETRVFGVVGNPIAHSLSPHMHNAALQAQRVDAVYLPFLLRQLEDIEPLLDAIGIDGLSVTIPFKEDALHRAAGAADARSRDCGASNTLVFKREEDGAIVPRAYNTDFDGVLGPLERRGVKIDGLSVGILGNGGAARGAAGALRSAGADVTLYYRNEKRGKPVAEALGVAGRLLGELRAGAHALLINATPVGLHEGDPSLVPAEVFTAETTAFDMIYDPPETPFLEAAVTRGAAVIPGREMLVSQGLVQFKLFIGQEARHEDFEAAFLGAQKSRRANG